MHIPSCSDKSSALDAFKIYKIEVENQLPKKIELARSIEEVRILGDTMKEDKS